MSTDEKIIKNKLGLLKLAEMLGNVSEACKVMGYSRIGWDLEAMQRTHDEAYRLT